MSERFADRPQFGGIKAAGDDRDLGWVGVVQTDQVFFILRSLGNKMISLYHDAVFHGEAIVREFIGIALKPSSHTAEGVGARPTM